MKISLLSRFEGGLLGGRIALERENMPARFAPWQILQDCAITTLQETGMWVASDWLNNIEQRDCTLLECQKTGTSSEVAAALLPIILFFHDVSPQLHLELTRAASLWLHPEESLEEILLWADAIATILQDSINMTQFLSHLTRQCPSCSRELTILQEAFDRGASLHQTLRLLSDFRLAQKEIAIALYCLSFTPEDFSLCWQRARQLSGQAPLAAILTGTIAGLYNGSLGFPPAWSRSSQIHQNLEPQILERARILFSIWSGCYRLDRRDRLLQTAIGATGTIQPRRGFATISQRKA